MNGADVHEVGPLQEADCSAILSSVFMAVAQPPKPGPSAALSSTNDLGNAAQHDARVPSSAPGWLPVCPHGNFACARLAERQQRTPGAALHGAAVERRFGGSGLQVRVALPFHDSGRQARAAALFAAIHGTWQPE